MFEISSKDINLDMDIHARTNIEINFDKVGGNWKALNGDTEEISKVI
jgi:hypothetical protein